MLSVLDTDLLPREVRFRTWREELLAATVPAAVRSVQSDDFQARLSILNLGAARALYAEHPALDVERTQDVVRLVDPGLCVLWLNVHGTMHVRDGGTVRDVGPRDLLLCDGARRSHWSAYGIGRPHLIAAVRFPRVLLSSDLPGVRAAHGRPLSGRSGIGRIVGNHIIGLFSNSSEYRISDTARLGAVTVDMISLLIAHHSRGGSGSPLVVQSGPGKLYAPIATYVQRHLSDLRLCPESIAAAHGISVRQLHRIFENREATVAAFIRRERIERCRRDLEDSQLDRLPVSAVGARWGFSDPAHFSRLFRSMVGLAPRQFRKCRRPVEVSEPCDVGRGGSSGCRDQESRQVMLACRVRERESTTADGGKD